MLRRRCELLICTKAMCSRLNASLALSAAQISAETRLSMADSIILATTSTHEATLHTQDEHFKDLPEVKYVQKPV